MLRVCAALIPHHGIGRSAGSLKTNHFNGKKSSKRVARKESCFYHWRVSHPTFIKKHPVQKQLHAIANLIQGGDRSLRASDPEISGWSVDQHVDHMLKVTRAILNFIEKGKELDEPGVTALGRMVLFVGRIPRGRAVSPDAVVGVSCSIETLTANLVEIRETSKRVLPNAELLKSKKLVFRHPRFRAMTAKQSLRFCEIHNRHHLEIIEEIHARTRG